MGYRSKYEKAIGRKIKVGYEVHHIDLNRKNNSISNLIELERKLHVNFHTTYNPLMGIIQTIKVNGYAVSDYENNLWLKSFCLPYVPTENWAKKLLKCTAKINECITKRNKILGIDYEKISYTDDEVFILNLNINKK